jgi:hypothetical protein
MISVPLLNKLDWLELLELLDWLDWLKLLELLDWLESFNAQLCVWSLILSYDFMAVTFKTNFETVALLNGPSNISPDSGETYCYRCSLIIVITEC